METGAATKTAPVFLFYRRHISALRKTVVVMGQLGGSIL